MDSQDNAEASASSTTTAADAPAQSSAPAGEGSGESQAGDMLRSLWAMQEQLNNTTFEKNDLGLTIADVARDPAKAEEWVLKYAFAMRQECAELADSTNWKWWRSKVDLFDAQNIKVELVDILHFWISACQVMGLDADDVFRMYCQKNAVNHQRQAAGYVTKDEDDCRHIG